jgi:hypothetical protein
MNSLIETSQCSSVIDLFGNCTDSRVGINGALVFSAHEQLHSIRCKGSFDRRSFDQWESAHGDSDFWYADPAQTIPLTQSFPLSNSRIRGAQQ